MNYRVKHRYSIILMSVREGAPYQDKWHDDSGLLEYEGHDEKKRPGSNIDPKTVDQPYYYPSGSLTDNGKFFEAVKDYKDGKRKTEIVQVYEKIKSGIWCDCGKYELIDAKQVTSGKRKVFRFFLKPSSKALSSNPTLKQTRVIPTSVKVAVWKRDHGQCVICGKKDNLHFDHDVPFSKGGSSITEKNVKLLCARHNLQKSDKIM
ncbi:MAG: HNH endonuclease [Deltaproteobacteria bacterium]|nr:HNH endonuclease [Deltaproteobacteria bacterium]